MAEPDYTRYKLPADMCSHIQALADAAGKPCYVALMPDGELVITDNQSRAQGARQTWTFPPSTEP